MKKIAVVLSGCGHKDGTEITEAVSLLIALSQAGAKIECFAPNMEVPVTNHLTGEVETGVTRNPMVEAARIARGQVSDLKNLNERNFDAVAFPGGFGAAKVLSTWAMKGSTSEVLPDVARVLKEFHQASKPIAAICIAPTLIAKVLGKKSVTVTIGNDKETASEIEKTGALHEECPVTDYITDRENKIITTPAYMYGEARPDEVFRGISGLAKEFMEMA